MDYITTDARGVAASKPLPLTRYKVVEVTAPAYWQVDSTVHDVTLEYSGQIIKLSAYDKPSNLGVTITKRGNASILAGSSMRYDFTVANTSNVALENFYWHDRIPTDAAAATVLTTGTYSARLNYRILYKTNYQTQLSGAGIQPAHQQPTIPLRSARSPSRPERLSRTSILTSARCRLASSRSQAPR